jgi:hypothetical protein
LASRNPSFGYNPAASYVCNRSAQSELFYETTRFPRQPRGRAGALALRAEQNTGSSPTRRGLKLGTVTYNIAKDWDIPTIIKNLTETGFEAVELRRTHKHGVEIGLSPTARAEVRKQFEGSPVKIGGLGTICEYHSPDPAVVQRNVEETKAWVTLAHDIRSPGVKVRPNGLPKDVPERRRSSRSARRSRSAARRRRIRA